VVSLTPIPLDAREAGRVCAAAGRGQRDLQRQAAAYPELFPPDRFDAALFGVVSMAIAFSAPWLDADRLRLTNRAALFAFAVDRLVDSVAVSGREVIDLAARCRAVAGGGAPEPDDAAGRMLAGIRDDLAGGDGYDRWGPAWRRELSRMLTGMAREWRWVHGGPRPSVDEYLDNADNLGLSFVYVTHLGSTAAAATERDARALVAAGRAAQRAVRLINDLGTEASDLATGDLNVLRLEPDRARVRRRLDGLLADCAARTGRLRAAHPDPAAYLDRHVRFNLGFYPVTDYWPD
jgi:hypothetical protein